MDRFLLCFAVLLGMLAVPPAANAQLTTLYSTIVGTENTSGVNSVPIGPSPLGTFRAATSFVPTATGDASLLTMRGRCVIPYPTGTTCRGIGEVSIQADKNGLPSGTALGTMGFYLTDSLSGQPVLKECGTLSPRVHLVAGTKYWAVMSAPDSIDWTDWTNDQSEVKQSIDGGAWTNSPNRKRLALRIDAGFDACVPLAVTNPTPGTTLGDMYVRTGGTAGNSVTMENKGVAPLTWSSADFSGADASVFSLTSQLNPGQPFRFPQQIGVGGISLMMVNCTGAAQERWYNATLNLHTNDPNHKDIAIPVKCLVDNTPPTITFTIPAPDGKNGWYVHPIQANMSAVDPEPGSGVVGTFCRFGSSTWSGSGALNLSLDVEGTNEFACSAGDLAGNSATKSAGNLKLDSRKPIVTPVYTPAQTVDGWNNATTTVSFTCADPTPGSGVNNAVSGGGSVTAETAGRNFTSSGCDDVAGNASAQVTATIRIDMTKPVISASVTPAPNAAGWNNSDVTVVFNCGDTGSVQSGIKTDTVPDATVTQETSGTTVFSTGTCADKAANSGTVISQRIQLDKTAPATTITSTAPPAATNAAAADVAFGGSDDRSGVDHFECRLDAGTWSTCTSTAHLAGLADGAHTYGVRAVDAAGNTDATPATQTWTVDTVAPQTTISSGPSTLTSTALAGFTYSGDPGSGTAISQFECRLDGGAWSACPAGGQLYPGLADGQHTFDVRAYDAAGNADPTPATRTWTLDTVAPDTHIESGPRTFAASHAAAFTYTGDAGTGSAIAGFECRLDNGAWAACANYTGIPDGVHTVDIRAYDAAGNRDASPASYTWTVDTAAPDTSITGQPPVFTASRAASFTFTGNTLGGSAIDHYDCRLDGGDWGVCQDYTGLAGGGHSFQVRAVDMAGNTDATPATATWTIDLVPPETSIGAHPNAVTRDRDATFTYSGDPLGGSAVTSFECRLDAGTWGACANPAGLAGGAHRYEVRAIDAVGNVDATPAAFDWTVDLVAPTTRITGTPDALSTATDATFTFSATDAGGSTVAGSECRVDGAAWSACSGSAHFTGLGPGAHTFDVRSTDAVGNVEDPAVSYQWAVADFFAVDDDVTTREDTPVVIDVAANDISSGAVTLTTDARSRAGGAVGLTAGGAVRYTPPADYNGTDHFAYTVHKGADSASASVTVHVLAVNDPPTFRAGAAVAVNEDSGAYGAPWASAVNAHEPGQRVRFTARTANPRLFSSLPAISPQGRLTFTPAANANGVTTVLVQLLDDGGASSALVRLMITVRPVDDAPVVSVIRDVRCGRSKVGTFRLLVRDIDSNGSTLTVSGTATSRRVGLAFGGSGNERTVSIARRPGLRRARVTIRLVDGAHTFAFPVRIKAGTAKANRMRGTAGADLMFGLGGRDVIKGRGGDDLICGGPGRDRLNGGRGNDLVVGARGHDVLRGGPGADVFRAVPGADRLLDFNPTQGDRR